MKPEDKIYVAGHTGLIGSALVRQLQRQGHKNLILKKRAELDLTNQSQVDAFFKEHRPDYVFVAAGKAGGVYASDTYRAQFLYENLIISANVIHHAYLYETKKLVNFGSASMYPKHCPQPMKEEFLLSGPLEPTSEPFAVSKLCTTKMCESYNRQYGTDFITLIPSNLFGVNHDYDLMNSVVIPSLIRKFHEAKEKKQPTVSLWGSGRAVRDFLFADDLADSAIFLMNHYSDSAPVNVGSGEEFSVLEAAQVIAEVVGYKGEILTDRTKPEGVLVKFQDLSRLSALGWKSKIGFRDGLRTTYDDFLTQHLSTLL